MKNDRKVQNTSFNVQMQKLIQLKTALFKKKKANNLCFFFQERKKRVFIVATAKVLSIMSVKLGQFNCFAESFLII